MPDSTEKRDLHPAVSAERMKLILRTLEEGLLPEDLQIVQGRLEQKRASVKASVDALVDLKSEKLEEDSEKRKKSKKSEKSKETENRNTPVSIENAQEIIGNNNFYGPDAVKKAFGIELSNIPSVPFTKKELERAQALGLLLILRVDKTPDGRPLTMRTMDEFMEENGGLYYKGPDHRYSADWYADESFFRRETAPLSWALVGRTPVASSGNESIFVQTDLLAGYARRFFNVKPSQDAKEAIKEFDKSQLRLSAELSTLRAQGLNGFPAASELLSKIRVNQLFRRTPVEIAYDTTLLLKNGKFSNLETVFDCTTTLSDDKTECLEVGNFRSTGLKVGTKGPGGGNNHLSPSGVFFSYRR